MVRQDYGFDTKSYDLSGLNLWRFRTRQPVSSAYASSGGTRGTSHARRTRGEGGENPSWVLGSTLGAFYFVIAISHSPAKFKLLPATFAFVFIDGHGLLPSFFAALPHLTLTIRLPLTVANCFHYTLCVLGESRSHVASC